MSIVAMASSWPPSDHERMHDTPGSIGSPGRGLPPPGVRADRYHGAHRDAIEACLDFRRTARAALAACDRFAAAFGLTDAAVAMLLELRRTAANGPASLAERAGVRRSSAAQTLNRLELDGWIARTIDERDRRRRIVRFTSAGRHRFDVILGGYYQIARAQLSGFSAADCARLRHLLARIRSNTPPPPPRGRPELDIPYDDPFEEWAQRVE